MSEIITVIGAGAMGHGIAQVAASAGYDVRLVDMNDEYLENALKKINRNLRMLVKFKELEKSDVESIMGRIEPSTDILSACAQSFLVIETVPEDEGLKRSVLEKAGSSAPSDAVISSNTSQISITTLAPATGRPEKFVGMHFFNPVPTMKLIEVARGLETSESTIDLIRDVGVKMGKTVVVCEDGQGFITSRGLTAYLLECYRIYDEGIAGMEEIDTAMKLGLNHPMGPFELGDYVGIDVLYHVATGLEEVFGNRFLPAQVLSKHFRAGHFGIKTGKGFYTYRKKS